MIEIMFKAYQNTVDENSSLKSTSPWSQSPKMMTIKKTENLYYLGKKYLLIIVPTFESRDKVGNHDGRRWSSE